ncbi:MAG TPA: DUF3341 domain-containing protein [Roseiflexaceae bacterium]|nr:DUF3341 domain-containing protein [Roseiflexaceae bacterium]
MTTITDRTRAHSEPAPLYGIVAEFETAEQVLEAARSAQAAGYTQMDAFSPLPIEGLSEAVGFKGTRLSRVVLLGGLSGATSAFLLQTIGMVFDYPYNIGGRPLFSWPMFIPITFEGTILFAAFSAVIGLIVACGFPAPYHPVFNTPNFERASQDRFFLAIEAIDPQFDRSRTKQFMEGLGAYKVSEVES